MKCPVGEPHLDGCVDIGLGEGNFLGYMCPLFWIVTKEEGQRVERRSVLRQRRLARRLSRLMECDPEVQRILELEKRDRKRLSEKKF